MDYYANEDTESTPPQPPKPAASRGNSTPTLIEYLRRWYKYEKKQIPELAADAQANGDLPTFFEWAEQFLAHNPPIRQWYPQAGFGLILANNVTLLTHRAGVETENRGAMQPSKSVGITHGENIGGGNLPAGSRIGGVGI